MPAHLNGVQLKLRVERIIIKKIVPVGNWILEIIEQEFLTCENGIIFDSKWSIANSGIVIDNAVGNDSIHLLVFLAQVNNDDIAGFTVHVISAFMHCFIGLAVDYSVASELKRAINPIVTTGGIGSVILLITVILYAVSPLDALAYEGDVLIAVTGFIVRTDDVLEQTPVLA